MKTRSLPLFLYALTIFLSAFLLFQVQPIIARIILPWFGGSASVWTTCLLFFQLVLLLGYLYAHGSIRVQAAHNLQQCQKPVFGVVYGRSPYQSQK